MNSYALIHQIYLDSADYHLYMMVDIILVHCKIVAKIRCKMDRPGFLLLMRQHFSQSAESPTPFSFSEKENSLTENEKKEKYNFEGTCLDEYSAPAWRRLNLFNLFSSF